MELFKKIGDWIKGAGKKIAAVLVSIASALFIGKILSKKKAEREILKKEISDLKKEIKKETKEVESKAEKIEKAESRVEETLQKTDVDSRKEAQADKKIDLKDILPDL